MADAKKYTFFKVKYSTREAVILETKTSITQKEARERCEKFYGHSDGFCVSITPKFVVSHIKIGLTLIEVDLNKSIGFKLGKVFSVETC